MKALTGLPTSAYLKVAEEARIQLADLLQLVQYLEAGSSPPFLARYRSDISARLSEVELRHIESRLREFLDLEDRRIMVLTAIRQQNRMTPELQKKVEETTDRNELEDYYLAFKPKRRSPADDATEQGLEPLARFLWDQQPDDADIDGVAAGYVKPDGGVPSTADALAGARQIIARWLGEDPEIRSALRTILIQDSEVVVTAGDQPVRDEVAQKKSNSLIGLRAKLGQIPWRQMMAIRRGVRERWLQYHIELPENQAVEHMLGRLIRNPKTAFCLQLGAAACEAFRHYLAPSFSNEAALALDERCDSEAAASFQKNLRKLLLTPPAGPVTVIGLETGRRGGWRAAVVGPGGVFLEGAIVYNPDAERSGDRSGAGDSRDDAAGDSRREASGQGERTETESADRESEAARAEAPAEGDSDAAGGAAEAGESPEPEQQAPEHQESQPAAEAETSAKAESESGSTATGDTAAGAETAGTQATEAAKDEAPAEQETSAAIRAGDGTQAMTAPAPDEAPEADSSAASDSQATTAATGDADTPEATASEETAAASDSDAAPEPSATVAPPTVASPTVATPTVATPAGATPSVATPPEATPAGATAPGTTTPDAGSPEAQAAQTESTQPEAEPQPAQPEAAAAQSRGEAAQAGGEAAQAGGEAAQLDGEAAQPETTAAGESPKSPGQPGSSGPPRKPEARAEVPQLSLSELISKHNASAIVIGNGPGVRQVEKFIRGEVRQAGTPDVFWVAIHEAGTWIYATSKSARREFPKADPVMRSAISLARRLQDPLAELVKVDPKVLGIGQYHHEVDARKLRNGLRQTMEECTHQVGADLNAAQLEQLSLIPGITERVAKRVLDYRKEKGGFRTREQLQQVTGLNQRIYEQAVGFLRVYGGDNPLDATGIHPMHYAVAGKILAAAGVSAAEAIEKPEALDAVRLEDLQSAELPIELLKTVAREFRPSVRQPRGAFKPPAPTVPLRPVEELKVGAKVDGVVTNIAKFGAFVDIGADQDGLVHVSQLSDKFVEDPQTAVNVGDRVSVYILALERDGKRISLSMKEPRPAAQRPRPGARRMAAAATQRGDNGGMRRKRPGPERDRAAVQRTFGPDERAKAREQREAEKLSIDQKLALLKSKFRTKVE